VRFRRLPTWQLTERPSQRSRPSTSCLSLFLPVLAIVSSCVLSPARAPSLTLSLSSSAHRFADLKRGLTAVTDAEWESLPEVGNLTGGKKQKRNPRFERDYAMPDSVTLGHLASNNTVGELTDAQMVCFPASLQPLPSPRLTSSCSFF
jgi:hypothetical protein